MSLVRKCALFAVATTILTARLADAETITQTGIVSMNSSFGNIVGPVSGQTVVSIQKFNSSLGTLQAITVTYSNLTTSDLSSANSNTVTVDNESTSAITFRVNQNVTFAASAGASLGPQVSGTGALNPVFNFAGADSDAAPDFTGSDSLANVQASGITLGSNVIKNVESPTFANYTGSGSVQIGLNFIVGLDFTYSNTPPTAPTAYRYSGLGVLIHGNYQVDYLYSVVPEPASLVSCGIAGLVGLAVVSTRRARAGRSGGKVRIIA